MGIRFGLKLKLVKFGGLEGFGDGWRGGGGWSSSQGVVISSNFHDVHVIVT